MSSFLFNCPGCGRQLEGQDEWIGMEVECPICKHHIVVAKQSETPAIVLNAAASDEKPCPFCGQMIKKGAVFCKHCKKDLPAESVNTVSNEPAKTFPYICPDCETFVELPIEMEGKEYECEACAESHIATPATGRKCPYCQEEIKIQATVCKFCRKPVPPLSSSTRKSSKATSRPANHAPARQTSAASSAARAFWGVTESNVRTIGNLFKGWMACQGLMLFFWFVSMIFATRAEPVYLNWLALLAGAVLFCISYYRYWELVPVNEAVTTPGKAVGFLFIPFFQLYWYVFTIWHLSKHYSTIDDLNPDNPFTKMPLTTVIGNYLSAWGMALLLSIIAGLMTAHGGSSPVVRICQIIVQIGLSFWSILWMFRIQRCISLMPRLND